MSKPLSISTAADRSRALMTALGVLAELDAEHDLTGYEVEVAPEFQRQGIGSALIDHILAIARRDGIETFVFTNHSNKAGVEFYKSTGGIIENGDDLLFVYPSAKDD